MTNKLKDLVDRATVCVEEVYDFYTNDDAGEHLGDVTIDHDGRCYGVSTLADHPKIERLLEARAKQIRAERGVKTTGVEVNCLLEQLWWILQVKPNMVLVEVEKRLGSHKVEELKRQLH